MPTEKKRKRGRPPKKNKTETIRFTMDMPVEFHVQILEKIEESEQMMKGYFIALASYKRKRYFV